MSMDEHRHKIRRASDEELPELTLDQILSQLGITRTDMDKYENYVSMYNLFRAVLSHQKPSSETLKMFAEIERILQEHIQEESAWKDDILNAIKELTKTVADMKPTVQNVSELETFFTVGHKIGWVVLFIFFAAGFGIYHVAKEIFEKLK